jgi:nucleoside-diphosphate-sugar epimerase
MLKIGITGVNGFIGSTIAERFRRPVEIYPYPRKDLDYLFLFGSPSSNIIFDQNIDWCFEETINSFLSAIRFCRDNKIKLIYPSSATVYTKNTTYARCKAILEEIHLAYGGNVLGCRIFAGYGNEKNKGEYASIIYQFCKAMNEGKRPIVFGDGEQTRDFIYVNDIVDIMFDNINKSGIIDIGTGINTSFNRVVEIINEKLKSNLKPIYVPKPASYVEDTVCVRPSKCKLTLEEGITRVLYNL